MVRWTAERRKRRRRRRVLPVFLERTAAIQVSKTGTRALVQEPNQQTKFVVFIGGRDKISLGTFLTMKLSPSKE